jgi:hypothetical protein
MRRGSKVSSISLKALDLSRGWSEPCELVRRQMSTRAGFGKGYAQYQPSKGRLHVIKELEQLS